MGGGGLICTYEPRGIPRAGQVPPPTSAASASAHGELDRDLMRAERMTEVPSG